MPLSELQAAILRTLAGHRSPDSYVAGATPLHESGPRYSGDIDIFHDREERVAAAAQSDAVALIDAGYDLAWVRREPGLYVADIRREAGGTRLEWARDSDFRFHPARRDPVFGYRLHGVDIATNKALAAAGRHAPRDAYDLVFIHERLWPLGAVIWAAVGKDPGYSPEALIAEIHRNARYRDDEYRSLTTAAPFDAGSITGRLRSALAEADAFVRQMPAGEEGLVFLDDKRPVQPDPARLDGYERRAGQRFGIWPGSSEIGGVMLEFASTGSDRFE